jgi:hypothetical protein
MMGNEAHNYILINKKFLLFIIKVEAKEKEYRSSFDKNRS